MRLDDVEKTALCKALEKIPGKTFLFGSRVDDSARGGDIDVLILSQENSYSLSQQVAVTFFKYCEEKIDVVVLDPERLTAEQRTFLNLIRPVPFP
jgi:predicted nucleotidyltransferase